MNCLTKLNSLKNKCFWQLNRTYIYVYTYRQNLALKNLQRLICHKPKNKQPTENVWYGVKEINQPTIQWWSQSFFFFFFCKQSINTMSCLLSGIGISICILKFLWMLCVSFLGTYSSLCIYNLVVWSNFILLYNS